MMMMLMAVVKHRINAAIVVANDLVDLFYNVSFTPPNVTISRWYIVSIFGFMTAEIAIL